jgi:hypothetical protein
MAVFFSASSLRRSVLGLITIGSLTVASGAIAQTPSTLDPLEGMRTQDSGSDMFNNNGGGMGLFDLYHNMNLNGGRSPAQFSNQQQNNINSAASDFRMEQLRRMQEQPQVTPTEEPTEEPLSP